MEIEVAKPNREPIKVAVITDGGEVLGVKMVTVVVNSTDDVWKALEAIRKHGYLIDAVAITVSQPEH